jgi:amidohydrolase
VALRADMDALPLEEATGLPFASTRPKRMHACGHDGHVAILLAVARVLSGEAERLRGAVKFVFQPAEEGKGGARAMIADGVLDEEPRVDEIYGLHLWNYEPLGKIVVKQGPLMAASDLFYISVRGKGGHGAVPNESRDAIVAAAHLVSALQSIVSRNVSPLDSAVVTVGTIDGGSSYNVIADSVRLSGTVRTFREPVRELVQARMGQICTGVGQAFAVEADLDYRSGYPSTVNESAPHVARVRAAALATVPAADVIDPPATMCAEDFAYYLQRRPGCFFFVGSAPRPLSEEVVPHHKSVFTFHEDAMAIGASVFIRIVRDVLRAK